MISTGFDGDEYGYIFWNNKAKKLFKSYQSYSGTRWYGGYELNEEDKLLVKNRIREIIKGNS